MTYYFFPRAGISLLSIPKNACSTLKRSLLIAEGVIDESTNPGSSVHEMAKPYSIHEKAKLVRLEHSKTPVLIALKDPLSRYASAYLDKLVLSYPNPEKFVLDMHKGRNISFLDFLLYVTRQQPQELNEHWRPQSNFVESTVSTTHFVRLEDMINASSLDIDGQRLALASIRHHSTSNRVLDDSKHSITGHSSAEEIFHVLKENDRLPSKACLIKTISDLSHEHDVRKHISSEEGFVSKIESVCKRVDLF
jgi:hypothetical protein